MSAWRQTDSGIEISVRVTPRASVDALARGTSEYFSARLAAPPVDGAANRALTTLVARTFGTGKRAVTLIAGETARLKRLRIEGKPAALAELARTLYGEGHDG